MSILERKLLEKKVLIAFHPPNEVPVPDNIPPRQHSFEPWQNAINSTFSQLSEQTLLRCINQCNYDLSMMVGKKASFNANSESRCKDSCDSKWLSPYFKYTKLAQEKAQKDFELCLKADNQFEVEPKDILECKRVMFNSYLDSVLDYEQDYLKIALEKYS